MSKRKGPNRRDAPGKESYQGAWLCSPDAYRILCDDGYRKLADCPEVAMGVNAYADMISNMSLHLMQNTDLGDVRIKNELSRKLDINPCRNMTRKGWMYNIVHTLLLEGDGNQFLYPEYKNGYLENLLPLQPSACSILDEPNGSYRIRYGDRMLNPDEVVHFVLNPDPDRPHVGKGFRVILQDAVRALRQANTTKKALMESPVPSIIVKVDGLTEEYANRAGRNKLLEEFVDSTDNGKPWLIPAEAFSIEQVKPLTLNDLAIAKNMELDKRVIAGVLGVPPYFMGVGEYKKNEINGFIATRVRGVCEVIQQTLTQQLLYAPDLYWRFNIRSHYAYDLDEIITAGKEMVDRMALRRNEWRDWIGFSPDADMEDLLALENYIPADRLGDQKKLNEGGE